MAHAIKTVLTYNLDGATKDFNIPFEYLARKFVVVTLIGVDRKVLVLNQDYRFANRTTISTTLAWGPAQGYTQIELRRYTSATERLVDFTDGSILRAYDLNVAQVQTLHVAEEARDLTADTIGVNNDGHLDARGRRIVNLANAVDDRDAVPLGQLKEMNTGAWQARNQAEVFKDQAKGFRDEAEVSRNAAEAAKARAGASELKAKDWAVKMDGVVEADLYSSKYYATQASNDRVAASQSQQAAAQSQQAALNSQNEAARYANESLVYSNNSKADADRAKAEADKLANNNKLAEAVESIDAAHAVKWKGGHYFGYTVRPYLLSDPTRYMEFNCHGTSGDPHGEIVMSFTGGRNVLVDWGHNNNNPVGTYKHHIDLDTGRNLTLRGGRQFINTAGPGFSHLGNQNTEIFTQVQAGDGVGTGGWVATQVYRWYNASMEFGIVRGGSTDISYGLWRLKPSSDSGSFVDVTLRPDGDMTVARRLGVGGGTAWLGPDGNIVGPVYGGHGSLVGWAGAELSTRAHDARRGPQQFTGLQNNATVWEVGNGYLTGYQNHTGDGNIKFSGWYFRVPMLYSNARQWFEFQNV